MQASPSPRSLRLLAVLTALACGVAQLAGFVHLALVRHAACREHGEWIHVDAERAHSHASRDEAPAGPALDTREDAHGHDHCLIALSGRDRALAAPLDAAVPSTARLASVAPRGPPPSPAACAIDPLRVAPKNSPPAA